MTRIRVLDPADRPSENMDPRISLTPEKCARLDIALKRATDSGMPNWITPAEGGQVPKREVHYFLHHQLKQGARIDMYRGGNADDMMNGHWCTLYDQLTMYQELMKRHQAPTSERGCGDAMEMVCGIAHATATEGRSLPDGSELQFISEESRIAWIDVWFVFQDMGLTPRVENDIRRQGAQLRHPR